MAHVAASKTQASIGEARRPAGILDHVTERIGKSKTALFQYSNEISGALVIVPRKTSGSSRAYVVQHRPGGFVVVQPESDFRQDCYLRPDEATTKNVRMHRRPPRSPNLNAYAERFVLSIKSECLDRMVLIGERHLRRAIGSYLEHYHLERCHKGLGNRPIESVPKPSHGVVIRYERLGGILSHYYRTAAWFLVQFWYRTGSKTCHVDRK